MPTPGAYPRKSFKAPRFFSGGEAVHFSPYFKRDGYNGHSHGCVNVRDWNKQTLIFNSAPIGTKVVVLPKHAPLQARGTMAVRPVAAEARPAVTTLPSGRQAMNISTSTIN